MDEKPNSEGVKLRAEEFAGVVENYQNLGAESTGEEPPVMGLVGEAKEEAGNSVRGLWGNKPARKNEGEGMMMRLSGNRSMAASGLNALSPNTSQLTMFYNGSVYIYDGIPAEKAHEIMLIAAAATKSAELLKFGVQSPIPTRPSSPQGSSNNLASPLPLHAQKSSICRLQEFPIARRQSLQRFLEKRRDRLASKAPYLIPSTTKVTDNISDSGSFKGSEEEVQPRIAAS